MKRVPFSAFLKAKGLSLLVLFSLFVAACTPEMWKTIGAKEVDTNSATLRSLSPVGSITVKIKSVDSLVPRHLDNVVVITSGAHFVELEAEYSEQVPPFDALRVLRSFEIEFAPGGSYGAQAALAENSLFLWIENRATGELVAGEAPGMKK